MPSPLFYLSKNKKLQLLNPLSDKRLGFEQIHDTYLIALVGTILKVSPISLVRGTIIKSSHGFQHFIIQYSRVLSVVTHIVRFKNYNVIPAGIRVVAADPKVVNDFGGSGRLLGAINAPMVFATITSSVPSDPHPN